MTHEKDIEIIFKAKFYYSGGGFGTSVVKSLANGFHDSYPATLNIATRLAACIPFLKNLRPNPGAKFPTGGEDGLYSVPVENLIIAESAPYPKIPEYFCEVAL